MKYNKLLITAVILIIALLSGCKGKEKNTDETSQNPANHTETEPIKIPVSDKKLLTKITYPEEASYSISIEYDDKDRISRFIESWTSSDDGSIMTNERNIIYDDDMIVTFTDENTEGETTDFGLTADGIDAYTRGQHFFGVMSLTEAGFLDTWGDEDGTTTYHYENGNMTKTVDNDEGNTTIVFKYDDKKSPFLNCLTPRWFLQFFFGNYFGYKNNVTEAIGYTFTYEYDKDGFPTKRTAKTSDDDYRSVRSKVAVFTYNR